MRLPVVPYNHYVGIDPGFTGAIARINQAGTSVEVFDMPKHAADRDRKREFDLAEIYALFKRLRHLPGVVVGLEWPSTRPGEGAERSERFGRGKGILEMALFAADLPTYKIVPNLWKGRLNLPGKTVPKSKATCAAYFDMYYPNHTDLIRGPRGGVKSGRMDALLIAHFLRSRTLGGMREIVATHGKGSVEAMAMCLTGGRKQKPVMKTSPRGT